MSEREKIVAWLRREAEPLYVGGDKRHILLRVANDIEAGVHLIRPEPTIPASEWLPKSNLTY